MLTAGETKTEEIHLLEPVTINDFEPQKLSITFYGEGDTLGRFFESDGQLKFEGNVDETARRFVEEITKQHSALLQKAIKALEPFATDDSENMAIPLDAFPNAKRVREMLMAGPGASS